MNHERHDRDEGAALVMAIAFVTVIGLLLAGALSYAAVSMKASSTKYTPARDRLYGADAGAKAAMLYVGANPAAGQSLPGITCKVATTYGTVRSESIDVQVCPQGTGATGSFPTPGSVRWGLVTLATGATKGLAISGSNSFQINGNVYSNSAIDAGTGSLVVKQGSLFATSCTGTVTVDGLKDCAAAGAGTSKDPGYLPGITAAPANATIVKACGSSGTASSRVIEIGPGKWTASLLTSVRACANVWLKPGIHYLEGLGSWSITNKVVAGATANGTSSGIPAAAVPGGCDDTKDGSMLYLAGTSTITVAAGGSLQVCGKNVAQAGGRTVRIPLYDSTTDIGSLDDTLTGTAVHEYKCGDGGSEGDSRDSGDSDNNNNGAVRPVHGEQKVGDNNQPCEWADLDKAAVVDTAFAYDTDVKKSAKTATITIDMAGTRPIPSSVTELTVNVTGVSTRTSSTGSDKAKYNVTILDVHGDTVCKSVKRDLATGVNLPSTPDTFTMSCDKVLTAPLQVEFYAIASDADGTRTIKLDGITLSYTVPGTTLKAHTAATAVTATTSGAPVWFGGEIYVPASAMSLRATALNGAVSTLGAVVRSMTYNADNSTGVLGSANNVYMAGGDVLVKAQVGTKDWLTCRITYALNGATGTPSLKGCTIPR